MDFELNAQTYYTQEANMRFMSVHQYLDFAGHMGIRGCEERAMAKLSGKWVVEPNESMVVGSYVDSYFEGTVDNFRFEHPEIFTKDGKLKASFRRAELMIERCEKDELFMKFLSGEKQKIFTAYLFGCDWKCKLDSYIPGKAIVDLKTTKDIHSAWKVQDYGYASFVEYWGYTIQLAVYQRIVEICTGEHLPCYIAAVTKEDEPEIAIIEVDDFTLENALNEVQMNMENVLAVKNGEATPIRCEHCDYCKRTRVLTNPINYRDLINEG